MSRENPLNPMNVNEVLRRERNLRQDTLRRESGSDYDTRPRRESKLIRKLVSLFTGRNEKEDR
jgi:hypothetical protein